MATGQKPKIIVLGGGLGAMSAAYWFTEANPDWRERYDSMTVYQMGWRLGGKGSSGRNEHMGQRIEEHGLHVWFGFYENAFKTMERLFASVPSSSGIATFRSVQEALRPQHGWTLEQYLPALAPHWTVRFPDNPGVPGRGADDFVSAVLGNLVGWARNGERIVIHRDDVRSRGPIGIALRTLHRASRAGGGLARLVGTFLGRVGDDFANWVANTPPHPSRLRMLPLLIRTTIDGIWESMASEADDEEAERARFVVDLVGTCLLGIVQDRLWEPLWFPRSPLLRKAIMRAFYGRFERPYPPSFESADGEELREWLLRHGAHPTTVASKGFLDQFYDVAFAYDDGDREKPNVAAGSGLRGTLRFLLGYKGAYLWRMNAGMGDTVFVPFYAALRERGVKFEFFHKVEKLEPSPDGRNVARIRMRRQARIRPGMEYRPLVGVGGIDCWPSEPRWEFLENADEIRNHLRSCEDPLDLEASNGTWPGVEDAPIDVGPDDLVVLGIPIGCLPKVCGELMERNPRWHDMVSTVTSIPTYAIQLWLRESTKDLGWESNIPESLPVLCGYDEDLHTWADMSHLACREWLDVPERDRPKSIAYFCGVFDDRPKEGQTAGHAAQLAKVRGRAQKVLEERIGRLWHRHPLGLDPDALHDPRGATGSARYDSQYWRVNVDPTERYTLSPKGSTRFRLGSDESGFGNLKLAGDWTRNGVLNMACVEGSVVSGMECAEAMSGRRIDIIARRRHVPVRDAFAPGVLDRSRCTGDWEADATVGHALASRSACARAMRELEKVAGRRSSGALPAFGCLPAPVGSPPRPSPQAVALVKDLFDANGAIIFLVLACYSLPSAYAAANGARVLGRTRYLLDAPLRRLCETAQFVIDVMSDPLGRGRESARRVRMIHAMIRHLIRVDRREKWQTSQWGVPLNQEDQAGTLMSFSWVVLDGLERLGVEQATDPATRNACIEVWSWIGGELGIRHLLPKDFADAEQLTRAIWDRQIVPRMPNPVGRELTQKLLEAMESALPLPGFDPFVSCMMRALLPPEVADSLGVPLRTVRDFATRKALKSTPLSSVFLSMLNDWGRALVDRVMRDADPDGMLVHFAEIEDRWTEKVGFMRRAARGVSAGSKLVNLKG